MQFAQEWLSLRWMTKVNAKKFMIISDLFNKLKYMGVVFYQAIAEWLISFFCPRLYNQKLVCFAISISA